MSYDPAMYPSHRGGYQFNDSNAGPDETSERTEETSERMLRQHEAAELADVPVERAGRPEHAETTPYAYGSPPAAPRESNYISEDNLLTWLAEKQNGLYGDLRERMDLSQARGKLMADLSHIQGRIETKDISPQEAYDELTAMQAAYEGTPFGREFDELFGPMLAELGVAVNGPLPPFLSDWMGASELEDLATQIKSKVDALGHDDQLELIQINSLSSALNQAAQLASNLLSSSNQTENAIIGNIGR